MALVIKDRVKETNSATGTSSFVLTGASAGFRTFADIGNGNTTFYVAHDQTANTWEAGIGTYTASGTTLSRDTVLSNSAGTAPTKISFANAPVVWCDMPANNVLYKDASGNAVALGTPAAFVGTNITGTATGLSIGGNAATATTATTATSATTATTATNIAGGTAGQIPRQTGAGATGFTTATFPATAGTSGNVLTSDGTNWSSTAPSAVITPNNYISGLTLSTAGSSSTFGVAVGVAMNSTNTALMSLASAYTKTTSAWAVGTGNGALDTGAIANSTWYHVWLIQRSDTGVVDPLISLSATAPTMPTNYDRKRRVGSMKTNGSAQWTKFIQIGDQFLWDAPVNDYNSAPSASAANITLTVPPDFIFTAMLTGYYRYTVGTYAVNLFSPSIADANGTSIYTAVSITGNGGNELQAFNVEVNTNTSKQIRQSATDAVGTLKFWTAGWIDQRGANG